MKKTIIILIFFTLVGSISAQNYLTKVLYIDQQTSFDSTKKTNDANLYQKKSVVLSSLMSFAVPGLGQFYTGNYLKSALFFSLEAAAITVGLIYDKKGDDQTKVFQKYANKNWDVAKYARWTIDNLENHLNPLLGNNLNADDYQDLFYDDGRTKVNWDALNRLESDIGGWYSHRLERFGEQQYYEMIGKYPQFNPGWDDFDEHSLFTYINSQKDPVTKHFDYYSNLRGKANSFYFVASKAVIVVVANHFISAIEAALSTNHYNKKIKTNLSIEKISYGYVIEYSPKINFQFNF